MEPYVEPPLMPGANDDYVSAPVTVQVLPAALVQMKVLPYTIVYLPPGNASKATFSTSSTFATTMTTGNGTKIDNSTKRSTSGSQETNVSADFAGSGFALSQSNAWD